MFEILPASGVIAAHDRGWGGRFASAGLHVALIGLAIQLSARGSVSGPPVLVEVPIYLPGPPTPATPLAPAAPRPSLPAPPAPPTPPVLELPSTLPPPSLPAPPFAAADPDAPAPGPVIGSPGSSPSAAPPGAPMDARVTDQPPVLLSHPAPRYPEVLRQAGIEARIVVEAVLDSLGRVEPGSMRIAEGGHALFEAEARSVVQSSRYRAGRFGDRAVRVRILVPVSFALRR